MMTTWRFPFFGGMAKEGIKKIPSVLQQIAIKSQGDIRAALNDLHSYSQGEDFIIDTNERRDVEESIFNILRKLFKERQDFLEIFGRCEFKRSLS